MTTEVLVCVLCRPADLSRDMPRPGRALFEAIEDMALRDDLPFRIRPVDCMSGCQRHCTVALQAAGKTSYFFGGLRACAQAFLSAYRPFFLRSARTPQAVTYPTHRNFN